MEIKTLDISKSYRGIEVVKGVSVSLKKGEIVGLLGPNGAGKTTTFDMIVGLISPDAGDVFHNNQKITALPMYKFSKEEQKNKLEDLINEFGLNHVKKNLGRNLSGGEKRRTEIARCLANNPDFILLDEPFAGVDPIAVEDIQRIVLQLKKKNIGILITDHNVQETLSIVDRAYLLFEGEILKDGTAEELSMDDQVRKVYLGQNFELKKKTIDF